MRPFMHSLFSFMPSDVPVESARPHEDPLSDRALFTGVIGSSLKVVRAAPSLAGPLGDNTQLNRVGSVESLGSPLKVDSPLPSLASCNNSHSMASMWTGEVSIAMLQIIQ